jgi:uncharacterized membrane protein YqaE (UPF0057 family)
MKMKTVLLLLVGIFCFATTQPAMAITSSTTPMSTSMIEKQSKDLKKEFKSKQKFSKLERFFQKAGAESKLSKGIYILLAILGLCFIGIGLVTDWSGSDWIIGLILSFLFWLPGLIYALIKMKSYYN